MIMAIDPGVHGAVAEFHEDGELVVWDMPFFTIKKNKKTTNFVDAVALADKLRQHSIHTKHIYIEEINSVFPTAPGKGPSKISLLNLGKNYGIILGVVAGLQLPSSAIPPSQWKRYLGLGKDKNESLKKATALYPQFANQWPLKKHDGRAEAVLIGHAAQKMEIQKLF